MHPLNKFFYLLFFNIILIPFALGIDISPNNNTMLKVAPDETLNKIIKKNMPDSSEVGFTLIDLDNNKMVYTKNEKEFFTPASVQKILTAIFALNILGPEYQFSTSLYWDGQKKGRTFIGNIYIKGNGDPFIKVTDLYYFVERLKNLGIDKIQGKLIYDEDSLITSPTLSTDVPQDHTYNTGLSALSLEFNQITLTRHNEKNFETIPPFKHIRFVDFQGKIPFDMKFYPEFKESDELETWYFSKKKGYQLFEELPVRHPGKFLAEHLKNVAAMHGIEIPETQKGILSPTAQKIYEHKGLPLKILTQWMLEYSNNLFAELLLLSSAKKLSKKKLDLVSSAEVMKNWLTQKTPSELWRESQIYNGSGLSGKSKLPPALLASILAQTYNDKSKKIELLTYLSVSGISGWIKNRLNSAHLASHVWAKTGTMDYVSTLAGYLFTAKGKRYAFSLMLQKKDARKVLDARVPENQSAINRLSQGAGNWRVQAQEAQQAILEHWVQNY